MVDVSIDITIDGWNVAAAIAAGLASSIAVLPVDLAGGIGGFIGAGVGMFVILAIIQVVYNLAGNAIKDKYKPGLFTHELYYGSAIVSVVAVGLYTYYNIATDPAFRFSGEVTTELAWRGLFLAMPLAIAGAVLKAVARRARGPATDEADGSSIEPDTGHEKLDAYLADREPGDVLVDTELKKSLDTEWDRLKSLLMQTDVVEQADGTGRRWRIKNE